MNYGFRAGGGIGDEFSKVSFYDNDYYTKTFFYNMFFQIVIVLVLGNIFLGVIVDTFNDLRDEKTKFEKDVNDTCFICQISSEKATIKNINFKDHVANEHHIWNYVNFIVYLYINNPMEFNRTESNAYYRIKELNISWIPVISE